MKKIPKPRFERVSENIIRIIVENAQDIPLSQILENREKLLKQKEQMRKDLVKQEEYIDQALKNIDEILAQAKRLGVVAKSIELNPPTTQNQIRPITAGKEPKIICGKCNMELTKDNQCDCGKKD